VLCYAQTPKGSRSILGVGLSSGQGAGALVSGKKTAEVKKKEQQR
jgi:hypothetical protein